MSDTWAAQSGLTLYPLKQAFIMETVDGTHHPVQHYVRPVVRIGSAQIRLMMKVCKSKLPMILGYPFLRYFKVSADWGSRVITFHHDHQVHIVPSEPAPFQQINVLRLVGDRYVELPLSTTEIMKSLRAEPAVPIADFMPRTVTLDTDNHAHPSTSTSNNFPPDPSLQTAAMAPGTYDHSFQATAP